MERGSNTTEPESLTGEKASLYEKLLALGLLQGEELEAAIGTDNKKLSTQQAAELLRSLDLLRSAVLAKTEAPELKPYQQRTPTYREASVIMKGAELAEIKNQTVASTKRRLILQEVVGFFKEIKNSIPTQGEDPDATEVRAAMTELVMTFLELPNPSTREIIGVIKKSALLRNIGKIKSDEAQRFLDSEEGVKHLSQIKTVLGKQEEVTEGFQNMRRVFYSFFTMDPSSIWEESKFEGEESKNIFYKDALMANDLSEELLSIKEVISFEFCPKVAKANTIGELRKLATTEPNTEESYTEMRDAYIKIELMHNLYYVSSEVNRLQQEIAAGKLDKRFDQIIDRSDPDCQILNPPNPKEDGVPQAFEAASYAVEIDRCEVYQGAKELGAIIRKMILKNLQKPGVISDFVRARIFLPRHKSRSITAEGVTKWEVDNITKESTKILAILMSHFGNDLDPERIRSSILSGGLNINSTGSHRGLHITFTYKYQDMSKGLTQDGASKGGAIEVEFQILGYMTEEEEREDHDRYNIHQIHKTRAKLGADLDFKGFIMQLADVVNSDYDFDENNNPIGVLASGNKPISNKNYREKALLLRILSKRNNKGDLVNLEIIKELLEDLDSQSVLCEALKKIAGNETKSERKVERKSVLIETLREIKGIEGEPQSQSISREAFTQTIGVKEGYKKRFILLKALKKIAGVEGETESKALAIKALGEMRGVESKMQRLKSHRESQPESVWPISLEDSLEIQAQNINKILKSKTFSHETIYRVKRNKNGELLYRKTIKYKGSKKPKESSWRPYIGPLRLVAGKKLKNSSTYTMEKTPELKKSNRATSSIRKERFSKYVIKHEQNNEQCYVYEKGGDIKTMRLLWEVQAGASFGTEVIVKFDKEGEPYETIPFNRETTPLHPEMLKTKSRREKQLAPKIAKMLETEDQDKQKDKQEAPKKKKGNGKGKGKGKGPSGRKRR